MPDIGVSELLIVLLIVLLVFGPGRLPQAGAALGRAIREFREALQGKEQHTTSEKPDQHEVNQSKLT